MHNARNTKAKTGTGTRAALAAAPLRANHQPVASTTGKSRNTRNSLTMTAALPAVSDTA